MSLYSSLTDEQLTKQVAEARIRFVSLVEEMERRMVASKDVVLDKVAKTKKSKKQLHEERVAYHLNKPFK